jgi:hypothetical protein
VAKEKNWIDADDDLDDEAVYKVSYNDSTSEWETTVVDVGGLLDNSFGSGLLTDGANDIADMFYVKSGADEHLFFIQEESASGSHTEPRVIRATLDSGSWDVDQVISLNADLTDLQIEGITFDPSGLQMFIVAEDDSFYEYRNFTAPAQTPRITNAAAWEISADAPPNAEVSLFKDGGSTAIDSATLTSGATTHTFELNELDEEDLPDIGSEYTVTVTVGADTSAESGPEIFGDINDDGSTTPSDFAQDIDLLFSLEDSQATGNDPLFYDQDGDGDLDGDDIEALVEDVLLTYYGDANLDRAVDGADLAIWVDNKFTEDKTWAEADFNGDGGVDGSDFNLWNDNKFTPAVAASLGFAEGDVNFDGSVDIADIDWLFTMKNLYESNTSAYAGMVDVYDLDDDSAFDQDDLDELIRDILGMEYGDANGDGNVNVQDLSILANNWHTYVTSWAYGDFNGDGYVDEDDEDLLNLYWGT